MSARHVISSFFMSLDDDQATQIFCDYDIVLQAVSFASKNRIEPDFEYANTFPGEHYRLLGGLIGTLKPQVMVDIGTFKGGSARVMLDYGSDTSRVHTFDLYSYLSFDNTVLTEKDFVDKKLVQHLEDLSDPVIFNKNFDLLVEAEFIMMDGPKDDIFESKFLHLLAALKQTNKPKWLFIDDIRFTNMSDLWRSIKSPKLDLSSFGHFSGSGLVNIAEGLLI